MRVHSWLKEVFLMPFDRKRYAQLLIALLVCSVLLRVVVALYYGNVVDAPHTPDRRIKGWGC
jgi:hypothetical protein